MDWNLRTCARRGHITYVPDESRLRQVLQASTPLGDAWRCLRCGDYVLGAPHGSGPAEDAPLVPRGRVLRDAVILRLLAVERFGRGLLIALGAYGVWRFRSAQAGLRDVFEKDLPLIRPLTDQLGIDLDQSTVVRWLRDAFTLRSSTLTWVAIGLAGYALLQLIEGVGLWMLKRWGEYFAAVATSVFLPLEVYELTERITWLRIGALIINLGAVVYLVYSKRLFGVRGGGKAFEAERHEASLLEVETSAHLSPAAPTAPAPPTGRGAGG
ncbi:MAG: hypothetical protein V7637_4803 [Mycobacteriales bacterium]